MENKLELIEVITDANDKLIEFLMTANSYMKGVKAEENGELIMSPEGCNDPGNSLVRKETVTFKDISDVEESYTNLKLHVTSVVKSNKKYSKELEVFYKYKYNGYFENLFGICNALY